VLIKPGQQFFQSLLLTVGETVLVTQSVSSSEYSFSNFRIRVHIQRDKTKKHVALPQDISPSLTVEAYPESQ
jgi:hypothetical protein